MKRRENALLFLLKRKNKLHIGIKNRIRNRIIKIKCKKTCVSIRKVVYCEHDNRKGVCHYEDTGRIDRWF